MRADRDEPAIHATAVAIGDRALLIRGVSRAGKSRLALALIARSSPARPIRLIGDDRILLHRDADDLVARPHPRIAGFIERRGLGLVAMPWVAQARVGGIVHFRHAGAPKANTDPICLDRAALSICPGSAPREPENNGLAGLPLLLVDDAEDHVRADRVLAWWAALAAAWAQHSPAKADGRCLACAED